MKVIKVDLNKIDQNENSRVVYKNGDLSDLMHSMKKDGLLQPVGVKALSDGRYEAVFGNRRILAAKKLGWADISANILESVENDNDRDVINLVENFKRQNTTVSEDGRIFHALLDRGLTKDEIAVRVGISKDRVDLALEVFGNVPAEYKQSIVNRIPGTRKEKGKISATAANTILNLRRTHRLNRKQTRELLDYAATDDASVSHIAHIAPLMKEGFTVGAAIKAASKMSRVVLYVFIDEKQIKRLETAHKESISSILWSQLEKNKELGVQRMAAPAGLRKYKNRPRSPDVPARAR